MKIFDKYYCHVTPTLWAVQPGARTEVCMGFATLPSRMGNDARGKCFKSNEVQLQFFSSEILRFILGSHVESWESFRRLWEFHLQSRMCYTRSCWNLKKIGILVAVCKPSRVCSLVLYRKALCWKVLPTLYACVFWSVSFIQCWNV